MKIMIAEDDLVSRKVLYRVLNPYGDCDLVVNGLEAIDAFMMAQKDKEPYDLICLDIMMPKIDGVKVLKTMRDLEKQFRVENPAVIIMTTALTEQDVVQDAMDKGCNAYAPKPIDIDRLTEVISKFNLI